MARKFWSFTQKTNALAAALMVLASCQAPSLQTSMSASRAAIINGSRETEYRNVVAVTITGDEGGLCTGSVVGPYTVLTAKHCVFSETASGRYTAIAADDVQVVVGYDLTTASGVEDVHTVRLITTTPGTYSASDLENGNDIALLRLRRRIDIEPFDIDRVGPTDGEDVTLVGFGRVRTGTPRDDDSLVKYRGAGFVYRHSADLIETTGDSWTCQGDSGGPLLSSDGVIMGVTSFGYDESCATADSFFTRVSKHRVLIADEAAWEPPCTPEDEICGDEIDNNCDGDTDEMCAALGSACTGEGECAFGSCEDVHGQSLCVKECDATQDVPRCPFGFHCEETSCGAGRCIPGEPGGGRSGDTCTEDTDCQSARCVGRPGAKTCLRACSATGNPCDSNQVCEGETPSATCGSCIDASDSQFPRPFGSPCETASQCQGADCESGFCTQACDAGGECPGGFHCRSERCIRGPLASLGQACTESDDCNGSAPECVTVESDRVCATTCTTTSDCASGYECVPAGDLFACVINATGLGEECGGNTECRSGLCAGVCTQLCNAEEDCPATFECVLAGDAKGCFPAGYWEGDTTPVSRGCAAAPQAAHPTRNTLPVGVLLMSLPALIRYWKRKRR